MRSFLNGAPREIRTLTHKALDPKSSAAASYAIRALVLEVRLELTQDYSYRCLRPARIPIPPFERIYEILYGAQCRGRTYDFKFVRLALSQLS